MTEQYWKLGNYTYPFYRNVVEKLIALKKGNLVLDAGCGEGGSFHNTLPLSQVVAVDVFKNDLQKLKKNRKYAFVLASIECLPFQESIFDLVVSTDVFEHLHNVDKAIEEISRVLNDTGELILSTSNKLNPALLFDSTIPEAVSEVILRKFSKQHFFERDNRNSPSQIIHRLTKKFAIQSWMLLGFPLFDPWIYQFSEIKPPMYFNLWIAFDKLTWHGPLKYLKEIMVVKAICYKTNKTAVGAHHKLAYRTINTSIVKRQSGRLP